MSNSISRNYGYIDGKHTGRLDLDKSLELLRNCAQQSLNCINIVETKP
jgi:hypothetical protein